MDQHLILFDGECALCHRAVRHIHGIDRDRNFIFAPLGGKTASEFLVGPHAPLLQANTLVLIENYRSPHPKFWIRSKAILRIYWLVGHGWKWLGILSFLPGFLGDLCYRWFASHRHR